VASRGVDVHYERPAWPHDLEWVGLAKLRVPVALRLSGGGECREYEAEVEIYTDLPRSMRGSNISRSVRALFSIAGECLEPWEALEALSDAVLKAHEYSSRARVGLGISVMGLESEYRAKFAVTRAGGNALSYRVVLSARGITACPSALAVSLWRANEKMTHLQRALIRATVVSSSRIPYAQLASLLRGSFSANLRAALKRDEESALVEEAFRNPLFTEDVARKALSMLSDYLKPQLPRGTCVSVFVRSLESIHSFDIVSEGRICW